MRAVAIGMGLMVLFAAPASGQGRDAPSPWLLGDPAGIRGRLQDLGIALQLFSNLYGATSWGGVDDDHQWGHSASYDFFARLDFEELTGWPGLDGLLHVKGQYDRQIEVGALSNPIDDADFDEPIYIDELFLQQAFFANRVRFRFGLLEMQTIFDRNAYANQEDRQFLATALDNNPLVPLPNGLGAALILEPRPWLELALGAADADNRPRRLGYNTAFDDLDSLTGYLELALKLDLPGEGELPGTYRAGVFLDGRERTDFTSGAERRGHFGVYLSFDQVAYQEAGDPKQGLGLFARFAAVDEDVNPVAWFWSTGLQYVGPLPGRARDVFALGLYQTISSTPYRRHVDSDFRLETGVEIQYRIQLLPWLVVTPDFQYIFDPGASRAGDDAVVVALRLRVTF